jgi:uncharacterized membrane protein
MPPTFKRDELDRLAQFYALTPGGTETLLEVSGARPSRAEGLHFLARCCKLAGVLSLAAGVVFFVAANWSRIAIFGRFALLELLLVVFTVLAVTRPPPRFVGRGALLLAFVTTGALLALFGQTYQTGADVYELFLIWALLGLPLVALARWGVTSATWVLVLNTSLLLYCGWSPAGGLLWVLLGSVHFAPGQVILCAAYLNLALWFVFEWREIAAVPEWVRRLILSCAFAFGTWAGVMAVAGSEFVYADRKTDFATVLGLAIAMAGVVAYALRRRLDIYPLAVVMGTFIIVGMVWLTRALQFGDEGVFFILALWLIGTSTMGGRALTLLMRRWRTESA